MATSAVSRRARLRSAPLPLRLLLICAAVLAIAWAVASPPLQGPDEDAHYAYAQHLAETGHRPVPDGGTGIVSAETSSVLAAFNLYALSGHAEARPFWQKSEVEGWRSYERGLKDASRKDGSGPNAVAKNPPLYYAYQAVPYRVSNALGAQVIGRLFWMRIANGLFFVLTVLLTWLIAAELFSSVLLRTLAAAVVLLEPMASSMSGAINPDSMLMAIWAGGLLVALRLLLRGFTPARVAGLFALAAASFLTHGRGLPLILFALVALGLAWLRHRPPVRRGVVFAGAGVVALGAAFVAYRIATGSLYGGELRFRHSFHPGQFASFVWQFYLPKLPFMGPRPGPALGYREVFIDGYLPGAFASGEVRFADATYQAIQLLAGLGLVALVMAAVAWRRRLAADWDVVALLVSLLVLGVGFLHLASYRAVLDPGAPNALIVGRYLLPLTPLLGLAVAFVVGTLKPRLQAHAAAVVIALGLLLELGALGMTVARFYA